MANSITTVSKYIPYLDKVYKYASRSSVLDAPDDLVRATADAKSVLVAKTSMQGLGNYNRNSGFVTGDVTLTWETKTLSQDRGRSFSIDAMDDAETLGVAFGTLASEFLRTKVAPEIDAYRFNAYAAAAGLAPSAGATLTKSTAAEAIDTAMAEMKENEVDLAGAYLFVTPTVYNFVKQSSKWTRTLAPGQDPNGNFGMYDELKVIEVPQTRFYKGITLADGSTSGQTDGGYSKTLSTGVDINFLVVSPSAVLQVAKHAKLRVFEPDVNQTADAYKIDYRIYHDAWVLDNKTKGIYAHCKAAPTQSGSN